MKQWGSENYFFANGFFNPLSANPTKWSNTLKPLQNIVFDQFLELALKELKTRWVSASQQPEKYS